MSGRILLLLAVAAAGPVRAQDAAGIIGRSSRVYRSLNSLRADFDQVIQNAMIDSSESRGTLMQSGESKFAMRFSEPQGEAIVIDGDHVWIYTPSTVPGQVLRLSVPSGGPVYGYNMLAWLLDKPAERYKATFVKNDRINGRSIDVVQLVPAVPDLPFDRAVLWLDQQDGLPRRLEITERSGSKRILRLFKLQVNRSLPDHAFTFEVPPGVRVVDQ